MAELVWSVLFFLDDCTFRTMCYIKMKRYHKNVIPLQDIVNYEINFMLFTINDIFKLLSVTQKYQLSTSIKICTDKLNSHFQHSILFLGILLWDV